jgi:PTEN phosphatase family protein
VYNLCSERTYDDDWFHNRVIHWPIDDHNVPTVREMVDFVEGVSSVAADGDMQGLN